MLLFMLSGHVAGHVTHVCAMLTRMAGNQCVMEQQFNHFDPFYVGVPIRRPGKRTEPRFIDGIEPGLS